MKFGFPLRGISPRYYAEVAKAAEDHGFESLWMPEHLVLPRKMSRSPRPGETHPPVPPEIPVFDAFTYLGFLAGATERIRLATHVYNIGLRHPFVAARAVQTLDLVSGGRAIFGVGASWLEEEWIAAQLDFSTRGRRVDECIEVCKRLWSEHEVAHHGEFFSFDTVLFEPKPIQKPWPPILVGGESPAALRRAAASGDGWVGITHTVESVAPQIETLRNLLAEQGRTLDGFEIVLGGPVESPADAQRWSELGVTRLIVSPWRRSAEAIAGLREFAERFGLSA